MTQASSRFGDVGLGWLQPVVGAQFYSEDEPRDDHGKWTDAGGDAGAAAATLKEAGRADEAVLLEYQDRGYSKVNEELRSGNPSAATLERAEAIDRLFAKEKERDVYLMRGDGAALSSVLFEQAGITDLRLDAESGFTQKGERRMEDLEKKMIGREFHDKAFVSATQDPEIALTKFVPGAYEVTQYGGSGLVEITGRSRSLNVDEHTGMGAGEHERLLPRSTTFRVEGLSLEPHPDGKRVYLRWRVRIV